MKRHTLVLTLIITSFVVRAQKTFQEMADDKKLDKKISIQMPGNLLDEAYSKLDIKKVALVSFYIQDDGAENEYAFISITEEGGNMLATKFYEASIESLKESFKNAGVELLVPEEFLNSDEKKTAYEEYEFQVGKMMKIVINTVENIRSTAIKGGIEDEVGVPVGYRYIPAGMSAEDYTTSKSLGDLTTALDVDAVLVVFCRTQTTSRNIAFLEMGMTLNGVNPIEKVPGKKYPGKSYNTGMFFSRGKVAPGKMFAFTDLKKKQISFENYDGFNELMDKFSTKFITSLQDRITASK